jgi:hypothetical protein
MDISITLLFGLADLLFFDLVKRILRAAGEILPHPVLHLLLPPSFSIIQRVLYIYNYIRLSGSIIHCGYNHVHSSEFNRLNHTVDLLLSRYRREVSQLLDLQSTPIELL